MIFRYIGNFIKFYGKNTDIFYKIFYASVFSIFPVTILVIWYFLFQSDDVYQSLPWMTDYMYFYRLYIGIHNTISHNSLSHLIKNSVGLFMFSLYISLFVRYKKVILQITTLTIISSLFIGFLYPYAIGYSLVINGLHGIFISICFTQIYYIVKQRQKINKLEFFSVVLIVLAVSLTIYTIFFDILLILTIFEPISHNMTSIKLPENYSYVSSAGHIFGFTCGIFIYIFMYTLESNSIVEYYREEFQYI